MRLVQQTAAPHDGRRGVPLNFFMLLGSYHNHPEAKSLEPDGKACESDTRGLLQRAHIVANWPPIYIGRESDKHREEGKDLSLQEYKAIEYLRKGYAIATDDQLKEQKSTHAGALRRGMKSSHAAEDSNKTPVRAAKLPPCLTILTDVPRGS